MTPFVGSAGNALNRVILSAVGTVIWGITSVGIGAAQNFTQANKLAFWFNMHWHALMRASASQVFLHGLCSQFMHVCVRNIIQALLAKQKRLRRADCFLPKRDLQREAGI